MDDERTHSPKLGVQVDIFGREHTVRLEPPTITERPGLFETDDYRDLAHGGMNDHDGLPIDEERSAD